MTYRERREARAEKLREWADGREQKAEAAHQASHAATAGIPFGQPILVGHHSERRHRNAVERGQRQASAAVDHARTATRHEEKADEIERQLGRSIYSDDPDAIERLREKLAGLEAKREEMKAANKTFRAEHREELKGLTTWQRSEAAPFQRYEISNIGGVITNTRKRIAQLEREQANGGPPDRVIQARYGGSCEDCGAQIERGDTIRYSRANGARCMACDEGSE
ncbi:MAG: DUF3560 domain-containing protein [Chloroflexi bacterium]|nr:DUF3560 domain-containing protein [Chloroflexota bacterium]